MSHQHWIPCAQERENEWTMVGRIRDSACLALSAESVIHLVMFFFYNKLTNNTFYHDFLAKRMSYPYFQFRRELKNYTSTPTIHSTFVGPLFSPYYILYSLCTHKTSHFGQWCGLQSLTLTSWVLLSELTSTPNSSLEARQNVYKCYYVLIFHTF
jgi:hypothetical protein